MAVIGGNRRSLNNLGGGVKSSSYKPFLNITPNMFSYRTFTRNQGFLFPQISAFSQVNVSTDATGLDVLCGTTYSDTNNGTISVFVNGVYNQLISFVAGDLDKIVTKSIVLPSGPKIVGFLLGAEEQRNTGPAGTYIGKITITSGSAISYSAIPDKLKRIVFLGDSITVGKLSPRPEVYASINVMRNDARMVDYSIASYGWGSASVASILGTTQSQSSVANELVTYFSGATDKTLVIELSTNDYGLSGISPTTMQANISAFITFVNTADPSIKVIVQTAYPRSNETTNNTQGFNLPQYRTASINAAAGKLNTRVINGPDIITLGDSDGLHPGIVGYAKIAEYYIRDTLGIAQELPVTFNNQYIVTDNTINGVTTISGGTLQTFGTLNSYSIAFVAKRLRAGASNWFLSQGILTGAFFTGFFSVTDYRFGRYSGANVDWLVPQINADTFWHHYVITKSGTSFSLYQDGYLILTQTLVGAFISGSMYIGGVLTSSTTGLFGQVAMDRLRFYNKTLSLTEVKADKNLINITDFTNVIAAYDFEGNVNDVSGKGNNGVMGSTVTFASS